MRAATPGESGTFGMSRYERVFRSVKTHPDPFIEFSLGWLRRNPPQSHGRESAIVDSGQFHHQDGRVVAVLDVEIGHIGDPMMDLAAWRMRDTVIDFGNFARCTTGTARSPASPSTSMPSNVTTSRSRSRISFHWARVREPAPESDLMTNLQWCCETNLFATEALAEILDVELPTVVMPARGKSAPTTAVEHLVRNLRSVTPATSTCGTSSAQCSASLPCRGMDEIADAVERYQPRRGGPIRRARAASWPRAKPSSSASCCRNVRHRADDEQLDGSGCAGTFCADTVPALGPAGLLWPLAHHRYVPRLTGRLPMLRHSGDVVPRRGRRSSCCHHPGPPEASTRSMDRWRSDRAGHQLERRTTRLRRLRIATQTGHVFCAVPTSKPRRRGEVG